MILPGRIKVRYESVSKRAKYIYPVVDASMCSPRPTVSYVKSTGRRTRSRIGAEGLLKYSKIMHGRKKYMYQVSRLRQ